MRERGRSEGERKGGRERGMERERETGVEEETDLLKEQRSAEWTVFVGLIAESCWFPPEDG